MGADEEPNRLRALLTLMREFGMTKVITADGVRLERPPLSPLEAAVFARADQVKSQSTAASKDDDDEDIDGDEAKEKELRAEWNDHWHRLTLSSGASTPAFPGAEKALRLMGRS